MYFMLAQAASSLMWSSLFSGRQGRGVAAIRHRSPHGGFSGEYYLIATILIVLAEVVGIWWCSQTLSKPR